MFRKAYSIATKFTRPVVLSRMDGNGSCSASIGTFVVINSEGWIVTAHHIMEQLQRLSTEAAAGQLIEAEADAIRADQNLTPKERQRKIRDLRWPVKTASRQCSAWWSYDNVRITKTFGIQSVDLAVGKLEPFDAAWIESYPIFKDPSKDAEPGTSLCKLGFPFSEVTPIWHGDRKQFELPTNALPLPFFPIDGIFTRMVALRPENDEVSRSAHPLCWIETSSPGLRGQSGGPTVDVEGTVWAIQVRTAHYPLDFDNAGGKDQYFNVGLGVHTGTMLPFFDEKGINYQKSSK